MIHRTMSITPRAGYVICTTARSGSTWFAEVLSSTGRLGHPSEYFSTAFQRRIKGRTYPTSRSAQIDCVLSDGMTTNGIYGFKIFPRQVDDLVDEMRWTDFFPNLQFVYWTRRDTLGQALSRVRALQTLQWRSTLTRSTDPFYDGQAILDAVRWVVGQDARWQIYFARNGLEPLRFVYEDVLPAAQTAAESMGTLLRLDDRPIVDLDQVTVAKQRDATTLDWRSRFLDEFGDRNEMDAF